MEHHVLFRVPLNGEKDLQHLILFYGLDAFGVIGPNLVGSQRPVFTRQAIYAFDELPKALYLFIRKDKLRDLSNEQLRIYLLKRADAYIFSWNQRHPESCLNARGNIPTYEPECEGRYIHCDNGHGWIHDPFRCNIEEKAKAGPQLGNAEEASSGKNLFQHCFDIYERSVSALLNSWAITNDYFDQLADDKDKGLPESRVRFVSKTPLLTKQTLESHADFFRHLLPEDNPIPENAAYRDETFYYEPYRQDCPIMLTYREVERLEANLEGMAYNVKRHGLEKSLGDPQLRMLYTSLHNHDEELPHEILKTATIYPELPMAYFIAGLNGDRPYAQALAFYQVLEFAARNSNEGQDLAALKNLLNDKQQLSDTDLRALYRVAINGDVDALNLLTPKGNFNRNWMAELIYEEMRNPTVHAGGRTDPPIAPYDLTQFSQEFKQKVRLTRELARHWVSKSRVTSADLEPI